MSHKKKAHQNQKTEGSDAVNNSGTAHSGTIIHQSDVIDSGVSALHYTLGISYIVYHEGQHIMICSKYEAVGNDMICCFYGYERVLSNSIDEYRKLKPTQIELEAYHAWNAGRRHHTDDSTDTEDFFEMGGSLHLM